VLVLALVVGALGSRLSALGRQAAFTTHGAFFALSVADLDASVRWYTEKLGLATTMRRPKENGVAVAVLEGGGLIVELLQLDGARPLAPDGREKVHGFFKAGVIVDDFDGALATLRARGVEIAYGPYSKRGDQRANVIIKDGAGNLIQLFGR
jgi:catechol 2,3-dioxygenase-like lactoylglutathione lyase family enzyme